MQIRHAAVAAVTGFIALSLAAPAHALSAKECSDKYKAAQTAGSLGGKSWNDFQRMECAVDSKPAGAPAAAPAAQAPAAPAVKAPAAAAPAPAAKAAAPAAAAPAVVAKGLTTKECGVKYQAAKAAGTLAGKSWNDFRKTDCAAAAGAAPVAAPAAAPAAAAPAAAAVAPAGSPVLPSAIAPKYASEKPGKARMHTCLDQYKANKATGGNAGLVWIGRKGGGYYSVCNKKLKGA